MNMPRQASARADRGAEIGLGLLILTTVFAILGYALSALGWRMWIAHKWNSRRAARAT